PPLNSAMDALALTEIVERAVDNGPSADMWRDKAKAAVANVLNLYQAWSVLIQYKNGVTIPQQNLRPFPVQALLDWVSIQLERVPPLQAAENIHIQGHQACMQEAILLLHSVAGTQGANVHLRFDQAENGGWFRVRFMRDKPLPTTLAALIASFDDHWRHQDYAFELRMAEDFVRLNNSTLDIIWHKDQNLGELSFFGYQAGVNPEDKPGALITPNAEHARFVANVTRSIIDKKVIQPTDDEKKAPEQSATLTAPAPTVDDTDEVTLPLSKSKDKAEENKTKPESPKQPEPEPVKQAPATALIAEKATSIRALLPASIETPQPETRNPQPEKTPGDVASLQRPPAQDKSANPGASVIPGAETSSVSKPSARREAFIAQLRQLDREKHSAKASSNGLTTPVEGKSVKIVSVDLPRAQPPLITPPKPKPHEKTST
ncbi:MAG: hypothetical protein ACLFTK_13405, partial [Anaerolineales bacterium]